MNAMAVAPAAPSATLTRSVWLAWREARPVVQCMFQLRFLAGASLAVAGTPGTEHRTVLLAGAAAWLCTTWHVYLLNGLHGQVEDRANGSRRPLATGRLDASTGRRLLGALQTCALLLGAFAGPAMVVLVAVMLGLGWCYSAGRRPGKSSVPASCAVIAAGGAATFLAGWYAGGGRVPDRSFAIVAAAMSLWMALAGLTKDLSDVGGDRLAGHRTLPVVLGPRRARALLAFLSLAVGAGALLTASWARMCVPFAVLLAIGALTVAGSLALGHRVHPRRPYRCFMIVQYAVHLALIAAFPLLGITA